MSATKKAGIRAIDQGTAYDVPGGLKALARAIERGDYGRVTDIGIVVRSFKNRTLHMFPQHIGTGTSSDFMHMAEVLKSKASR
jgi:hypothetical protein